MMSYVWHQEAGNINKSKWKCWLLAQYAIVKYGVEEKNCRPWLGFWNSAQIVGFHKQAWQQSALESAIKGLFHVNIGDGIIGYFGPVVEILKNIHNYGFINESFASKMQINPMGSRHNVASYQTYVGNEVIYLAQRCKWDNTSHIHLLYDSFCEYFGGNNSKIFLVYFWKVFEKIFKSF